MLKTFFLCLVAGLMTISTVSAQVSPDYLNAVSVKITTTKGSGSGVVLHRKDSKGKDVWLVWSVGHCFQEESLVVIDIFSLNVSGTNTPLITHAEVMQSQSVNGESVSTAKIPAKVLRISEDKKNDLALLILEKPFFNTNTVTFDLKNYIPHVGEKVYNVGAPFGDENTYSEGLFSFVGRKLDGYYFDQTTCVIYPGSSGGGYWNTNGLCVGLADVMRGPSVNFMVPIRRIQSWAKHEHLEWALDPSLPMPSEKELEKAKIISDL